MLPHLAMAAAGKKRSGFLHNRVQPFPELKHKADVETEALVRLGRQVLVLKEKLGEAPDARSRSVLLVLQKMG